MNLSIDTRSNDAGTAERRLLLLVENQERAASLSRWVQTQTEFESVDSPAQALSDASFDICVFDRAGYQRHETQLVRAKRRADASFLPYLLVVPEQGEQTERPRKWSDIEREFDGMVDDVLRTPLRDVDVRGTVERASQLRRETVQHNRTSAKLEQFERTVNAMEHALYVTDTEGTIEFVNPAFTAITGYEPSEALGQTPALLRSGYHDEEYYRRLWKTISSGVVWAETVVNERKNGQQYHAEQTIVPVTDDDGAIRNYVAVQTDITERVTKTRQLEVLARILRHNLRNDVNVIQSRAEILEQETPASLEPHAEKILAKSRDLVETADKEREIVRLLLESQPKTEQNISQMARYAVESVRSEYPDAAIDVTIPDGVRAVASPKLDRAIEELLVNGIVHNDIDPPTVDLSVVRRTNSVEITVADDGPGIPDTETAVLTGEDSLDPLFHGSGLGLWLVYWIARLSKGELAFAENNPHGSVVTLRLTEDEAGPERLIPTDIETTTI
jgi:PAS domain S-box-containing protein